MQKIKVCHGHACQQRFANYVFERARLELGIENEDGGTNKNGTINLEKCLCQGKCAKGPVVVVEKNDQKEICTQATPIEISKIIKKLN